jgi:hypothetical protein
MKKYVNNNFNPINNNSNSKNFCSTRNSTESNESGAEINQNYPYARKCKLFSIIYYLDYTPTHQNTNYYTEYNLSKVQRELDFQGMRNSTNNPITSNYNNNGMNLNKNFNKFNGFKPTSANINTNSMTKVESKISNPFYQNTVQATFPYTNVSTPTSHKSMSFCGTNLIKSPTGIKFNLSDMKIRTNNGMTNYNSNNNYNNPFSPDQKAYQTKSEEVVDYKINLENIIIGKDKRTTIMIRNIPNKYTLTNLVDEVNVTFVGKYDYINLPVDYERKLNLGYAFINFIDPFHIVLFYETYYHKKWNKYRSDKVSIKF